MSDGPLQSGISGLSFDSLSLSPVLFFSFFLVLLLFLPCHFSASGPFSICPPEHSQICFVKERPEITVMVDWA